MLKSICGRGFGEKRIDILFMNADVMIQILLLDHERFIVIIKTIHWMGRVLEVAQAIPNKITECG